MTALLKERIEGGLLGLLIGDALGVPYEFHPANEIPPLSQIEFDPPSTLRRSHNVPPGTWSDDGAQALVLLASLNHCSKLDLDDFGRRLVNWHEHGYMAVDNYVFDVGIQTSQAIDRLMRGVPANESGATTESANGNGSLMRVLPLALWHKGTDEDLVHDAHQQSIVTHGHMRSQVCCALYCLWARCTLTESKDAWTEAASRLIKVYENNPAARYELEGIIRPQDSAPNKGSGYVVDCLRSARWANEAESYEEVVKRAISLGNDTDTTACVAGGIAGIRFEVNQIPEQWRTRLRGKDLYEPLLQSLLDRYHE